ncbi:hypothetical protein G3T36_05475 [Diaminobutyricibacter tongyongensis]|uniref:AbiTii domain-containing protein n=1 Tax=Leifsonia tongyongensis TaxID=1268043 RepID=A0A6L9XVJ3_9MICO|nr:hypothetical protein [Diaminobutyricibacter tongyongensis]NEN05316.1 hypothetical protein [Diaminobutyricibacter tongyongensis]
MTLLDDIITGSTQSSVATADLLRMVRIATYRLGASDISAWAKRELDGYADDANLPGYRNLQTNVLGIFAGPMQSRISQQIPEAPGFADLFKVELRQPIIELQSFAEAEEDATRPWTPYQVQRYEKTGQYQIEFYGLFSASNVLTRSKSSRDHRYGQEPCSRFRARAANCLTRCGIRRRPDGVN